MVLPFSACSNKEKVEDGSSLRVGMVVGGIFDQYVPVIYPGASIEYFYSASDLPMALKSGKIDVYIDDELSAKEHCKTYDGQKIDRIIHDDRYGFLFDKKHESLRDQMNVFLKKIEENGRLAELQDIWLNGEDESLKVVDYDELNDNDAVIKIGIVATMPPINYVKDGEFVGYELAILKEFCKEYNYRIEFYNSDFSSIMAGVTVGTYDIGAGSYSITEERKKRMLFSEPYMTASCVAVVRTDDNAISTGKETGHEKVGVVTGALFDVAVRENNPNAEIEYYNITSDLPVALDGGKIDAYSVDEPVAKLLCNLYEGHYIEKKLTVENYGIVISKNKPELKDQFNEYLVKLKKSGELEEMQDIWMGANESKKVIDFDSLASNKDILKLATTSSMQPFDYMKDGKYAGYEIALVASFCKEYGYGLEIEDSNFASVIASVSSGKADLGCCVITITDERKQTMNFTDSIYEGGIVNVKKKIGESALIDSFEDLTGKNIGIQVGAAYDPFVAEKVDKPVFQYFNFISDMNAALDSNKISAYVADKPVADVVVNNEEPGKYKILGSVKKLFYGIAFPKANEGSKELCEEFNEFLKNAKDEGILDEIYDIWTGNNESKKEVDKRGLTGEKGTLVFGVSSNTGAPFVYIKDNDLVGCDVDIVYRFCREYGYDLAIEDYSIDGLLTALSTSKCDIGSCGLSITEERKNSIYFSDPYYESDCVIVVKDNKSGTISNNTEKSFFDSIASSFNKTFIKESRWKLFISGVTTTILVTILSIIIGSVLGFVMYMLYRDLSVTGRKVIDTLVNIIQKTPVVVILMIFYYIIFGSFEISGIIVSVIGLSILFASAVKGLIAMGVNSIDKGQTEAAYTLGYTKNQAFIKIIFPQAVINVVSGYKSAIITLIKDSAIVGYIAVQDLTKVSDIIRSRTYEAFFPLIATAIIYYVIATFFVYVVSKVEIKIDPKKRTEIPILKGVKLDDKN